MRAGISSREQLEQQLRHRLALAKMAAGGEPGFRARLGQRAHPADIGRALGHADHAARVQQVEQVAGLEALVVGRQRQLPFQDLLAVALGVGEVPEQDLRVGDLEVEGRVFALGLQENVAVGTPWPLKSSS